MRVVAILAAHNEERFLGDCLDDYAAQGVETYLIDNDSTDRTLEIARAYEGHGLIGIERMPRQGVYSWQPILERKAELACELGADWYIHADPDEVRLPPPGSGTLSEALAEADEAGSNAINFLEFTFVPTIEEPDHDHPGYRETMRFYYPTLPVFPHRLNAWKRQPEPVDLTASAGHVVSFDGLRMHPGSFPMRHYLFLSHAHAVEKYVSKVYDPKEVECGHHRARASLSAEEITLPSRNDLREYRGDDHLDASEPLTRHPSFPSPAITGVERSDLPIVVGGCHRSGTSLLRRILDSHSRIHCGPEVPFFRDFYGDYSDDPYAHLRFSAAARSHLAEDELLDVLGAALVALHEQAAKNAGKRRWADKAPENVLHAAGWERLLGQDRLFVWVVRNPLDTLASMVERPFPLTLPSSVEGRISHYARMTEAALFIRDRDPERTRVLVYEELAADPEAQVERLMSWLGERSEPVQLDFNSVPHQAGLEDPKTAATSRVHSESVGAWRDALDALEAERIWRETRDVWTRVDPDLQWIDLP